MTDEQIREFAKQSGAMFEHMTWVERDLFPVFKRFAELVAEHEREACVALVDVEMDEWGYGNMANIALNNVAAEIRARGEK